MEQETRNIETEIKEYLNKIRHHLQEDKGDVEFVRYDEAIGFVYVRFLGNCKNCPLKMMTLQAGIERYIKHSLKKVKRVMEVN